MGMPGFSGFVAEIQVLIGSFRMSPWLTLGAAIGILLTVAYILNAIHKVFYAEEEHVATAGNSGQASISHDAVNAEGAGEARWNLPPISIPERVGAVILLALLVIIGLYPSIMLDMIKANVELFLRGRP